ncbi:Putative glycosyl transferase [Cupriavidus taiwanensis]|uniref:glycosyltransferase family 2 protein n=1 Tax=Cupriavidus taiwanensis TaxID=164546 RepID=UPI000E16B42F|nr:glycosyltransferase family A protein [Cupriavidus taiwanensis]SPA18886.1 Putative glycosyl transferase [Cupriavidus taiwanensis]
MQASTFLPSFSVCVSTRDHPDGLRRTLQSIAASTTPPHQLIVCDDSSHDATRALMRDAYPDIPCLDGPRRGAAASRNRLLRAATGTHVLFLDDHATLGPTFLQQMGERLADDFIYRVAAGGNADALVLTGTAMCAGQCLRPQREDFLGQPLRRPQRRAARARPLCAVVLSSTVFPRALLERLPFDECLDADYDVADLTGRAVYGCGCRIELIPSAINQLEGRLPPPCAGSPTADAARMVTMLHRYGRSQHRHDKAALFLMLALPHNLGQHLRRSGWRGVAPFWATTRLLWQHLRLAPGHPGSAEPAGAEVTAPMPRT